MEENIVQLNAWKMPLVLILNRLKINWNHMANKKHLGAVYMVENIREEN